MERFVFWVAIVIAVLFGLGAMFGKEHFHFDIGDGGRPARLVQLASGSMQAQSYAGEGIRIRHAAARVVVIPEERTDYEVAIDNSAGRTPMPTVTQHHNLIVIDGQLRGRIAGCADDGGAHLRGYDDVAAEQMPVITIRAPRRVNLDRSGAGLTEIGPADAVELDSSGCGDVAVGDVAGALEVDLAGSGHVRAGAAQRLAVDLAGSGEVSTGAIAEAADVDIAGSGRVSIQSLNGALQADAAGSGNLAVQGGAISTADIELAGSGDVDIAAPVERLEVAILGSGNVDVSATVGEIDAEIAGSGGVRAASVSGQIRQQSMGSGSVQVDQPSPPQNAP